jgi:hypothetical protein
LARVGAATDSLVARRVIPVRLKTILAGISRLGLALPIHKVVRILRTVAAIPGRVAKVSAAGARVRRSRKGPVIPGTPQASEALGADES